MAANPRMLLICLTAAISLTICVVGYDPRARDVNDEVHEFADMGSGDNYCKLYNKVCNDTLGLQKCKVFDGENKCKGRAGICRGYNCTALPPTTTAAANNGDGGVGAAPNSSYSGNLGILVLSLLAAYILGDRRRL